MNDVLLRNIKSSKQLGAFIAPTMGPYGNDKLIIRKDEKFDGYFHVSNNAGFLLRRSKFRYPATKVIAKVATSQENQYGDGTATVVLLASEILVQLEPLLNQGYHPTRAIKGISEAMGLIQKAITQHASEVPQNDKQLLKGGASTALTGKVSDVLCNELAEALVSHCISLKNNKNNIQIEKFVHSECVKTGTVSSSRFFRGAVMKKSFAGWHTPSRIEEPVVATLTEGFARQRTLEERLESEGPSSGSQKIQYSIKDASALDDLHQKELELVTRRIEPLKRAGVNVVFIEDRVEEEVVAAFNRQGIAVVRNTQIDLLERISTATGSRIQKHILDFSVTDTGTADTVLFHNINGQDLVIITRDDSDMLAIEIHGASRKIEWEIQRNIRNAVNVLRTILQGDAVVPGGGAIEAALAHTLQAQCYHSSVTEPLVVEAVSEALESIPITLAMNAGLNGITTRTQLRNEHNKGRHTVGFCGQSRTVDDVNEEMILEPLEAKLNCLLMASEVCSTILRIDDMIYSNAGNSTE